MAFLILKPTITAATTILGYEGHVKYFFREIGCSDTEYLTPFLGQIRHGIKNTYPPQANKRKAFLLPHFLDKVDFIAPGSKTADLTRLATVLGFVGMLRLIPSRSYDPRHSRLFLRTTSYLLLRQSRWVFRNWFCNFRVLRKVLGFYITFRSKTMAFAQACFPNLSSHTCPLSPMCPLALLISVAKKNWVKTGFLKRAGRGDTIENCLQLITTCKDPISPYALRIGGRTWYVSHGLDRQFCEYFGT